MGSLLKIVLCVTDGIFDLKKVLCTLETSDQH